MFVTLLQMMGFPLGMPVHSRAEGPGTPALGAGDAPAFSQTQSVSVRRQKVNAKTASATPYKAVATKKPAAKTPQPAPKPVTKSVAKTAAKTAKPVTVAQKASLGAAKKPVVAKTAVKPAVTGSVKASMKDSVKTAVEKKPKPPVKTAITTPAKATAKPVAKAPPKAAPKAPAVKADVATKTPTAKTPAVKPLPKASPAKTPIVVAEPKVNPPVNVTASTPPAPTPAPAASASSVPVKSGRPSSRLAQLTVPSMAQSVASTAAKSSFNQASQAPDAAPVIPAIVKKDSKLANNWKTTPVDRLTDAELLAMPDSEYMNDVQMAAFRLKLTNLKREILNNAGETTEHLREDTSVVPDPADRATIEEEHALELRTRDRERKLLKKIEQSIARIDAGDYGYCDETGEVIGVGRLLARPTATLSLEAQQRRELKQKMFGD